MIRKFVCMIVCMAMIFILPFECFADRQYENISSREEFLRSAGDEELLAEVEGLREIQFNISYKDDLIILDTIYEGENDPKGSKTGKVSHDVYSDAGLHIYTVTAEGKFRYGTGYCSVDSKSGSFSKLAGSLWTSTPSVTQGFVSATKAYVKVSGTATCAGFVSRTYDLRLYCTSSGTLSSTFSGT